VQVTLVDLEASLVRVGEVPPTPLPPRDRAKLLQRLQQFATLRLPPGTEMPSLFHAFPGGRLVTTTTKSHIIDPNVIPSSPVPSLYAEDSDEGVASSRSETLTLDGGDQLVSSLFVCFFFQ